MSTYLTQNTNTSTRRHHRSFSGGPGPLHWEHQIQMTKTPGFQCRGPGFDPWSGN